MSSARNEITGDVMANVKGDREKFEAGWDAIFGKKDAIPAGSKVLSIGNGVVKVAYPDGTEREVVARIVED